MLRYSLIDKLLIFLLQKEKKNTIFFAPWKHLLLMMSCLNVVFPVYPNRILGIVHLIGPIVIDKDYEFLPFPSTNIIKYYHKNHGN
jgi:hypothetical protein